MNLIKSKVRIPLGDNLVVSDIKSGNLLHMTRDAQGANPSDAVVSLNLIGSDIEGADGYAFRARTLEIEPSTFGMGIFNRLTEIETTFDQDMLPAGIAVAQVFWATETGAYDVRPSTVSKGRDWYAVFELTRAAIELKVEAQEIVDWTTMSRADRIDFVLRKFSELLNQKGLTETEALRLATHRHYKGGLYRELGTIRDADHADEASRVLYLHLYPHENSVWHRNAAEFHGYNVHGEKRFAEIEDTVPFILNDDGISMEVNVVLRVLDDAPQANKTYFGGTDVDKHLADLNERARTTLFCGEYNSPLYSGEHPNRFFTVDESRVCCRFMSFTIADVITLKSKRVKALVARVQPMGPMAMEYIQMLREDLVGFAMRMKAIDTYEDNLHYQSVEKIITFDFAKKY